MFTVLRYETTVNWYKWNLNWIVWCANIKGVSLILKIATQTYSNKWHCGTRSHYYLLNLICLNGSVAETAEINSLRRCTCFMNLLLLWTICKRWWAIVTAAISIVLCYCNSLSILDLLIYYMCLGWLFCAAQPDLHGTREREMTKYD